MEGKQREQSSGGKTACTDLISIQSRDDGSGATSTSLKFKELIEEALTPLVD